MSGVVDEAVEDAAHSVLPAARLRGVRALALLVGLAVVVGWLLRVIAVAGADRPVDAYQATIYWWNYQYGFTRRALPGEVLTLFGGATDSRVTVAALALSVVGAVACAVLAVCLARTWHPKDRWVPLLLLLAGPFTWSLIALDLGRYDAVGYVALAGVAVLSTVKSRSLWRYVACSVLLVVAVASEEFLLAFLIVPAVLLCLDVGGSTRRRGLAAVLVVAPGCLLALLLVVHQPSAVDTRTAYEAAVGAGVPAGENSAVLNLSLSLHQQLDLLRWYDVRFIVLTVVFWATTYAVHSYVLVRRRPCRPPWVLRALVLWPAVAAVGLGLIGVDYRRWWALALLSLVASLVVLGRGEARAPVSVGRVGAVPAAGLLVLALLICAGGQSLPIDPGDFGLRGILLVD